MTAPEAHKKNLSLATEKVGLPQIAVKSWRCFGEQDFFALNKASNPWNPFFRRRPSGGDRWRSRMSQPRWPPSTAPAEATANKWTVYHDLCAAKLRLGLPDRSLTVLEALLTFHPETVLTGDDLIVFPSNDRLALRAKGMAPTTMRRHLALLVDAGIIIRRDSPNGKRFARKTAGGSISPGLRLRSRPARRTRRRVQDHSGRSASRSARGSVRPRADQPRQTRHRQDHRDRPRGGRPNPSDGAGAFNLGRGPCSLSNHRHPNPTSWAPLADFELIAEELSVLADRLLNILETHVKTIKMGANERQSGRHIQNSNTNRPH